MTVLLAAVIHMIEHCIIPVIAQAQFVPYSRFYALPLIYVCWIQKKRFWGKIRRVQPCCVFLPIIGKNSIHTAATAARDGLTYGRIRKDVIFTADRYNDEQIYDLFLQIFAHCFIDIPYKIDVTLKYFCVTKPVFMRSVTLFKNILQKVLDFCVTLAIMIIMHRKMQRIKNSTSNKPVGKMKVPVPGR